MKQGMRERGLTCTCALIDRSTCRKTVSQSRCQPNASYTATGVETRQDSGPLHVNKQVKSLRSQSAKNSGSCIESHSHPVLLPLKLGTLPLEPLGSYTSPANQQLWHSLLGPGQGQRPLLWLEVFGGFHYGCKSVRGKDLDRLLSDLSASTHSSSADSGSLDDFPPVPLSLSWGLLLV